MVEQILKSIALPVVVAAVIFVIGWRPWRRKVPYTGGQWSGAPAFAAAFVLSFISEKGIGNLKPTSKGEWIVHLAIAAGVIGLLAALVRKPKWLPWLAGPLVATASVLIFRPLEDPKVALLGLSGLFITTLAGWLLLEPLAKRRPGASLPLAFMLLFTGISMFFFISGGLSYSILFGAMSGVCGAALVTAWLNHRFSFHRGATAALAALPVAALWIRSWYYMPQGDHDVPWFAFVLPLLAFPLLWLGELPMVTKRPAWVGVIIRALLVAIPLAAAVILAIKAQEADPYSGY